MQLAKSQPNPGPEPRRVSYTHLANPNPEPQVRFTHLAEECNDIMLYGTCVRFAAQHWDAVAASAPFANLCKLFPLEAKKLSHDVQALACTRHDEHDEYPNPNPSHTDYPDAHSQDARSSAF